jgi:site-specific recombinase XerD
MKPKTWLFPGTIAGWRADKPITPKVVWDACQSAATRAHLEKRVSAHLLRHYLPFLTMSSDLGQLLRLIGRFSSQRGHGERIARHSLLDPTGC